MYVLTLQVVDDHEGQGVAGDGHVLGVIDPIGLRPQLDDDDQRPYSPIHLGVGVQQVGVAYADGIVAVQVHLVAVLGALELQYGHFGVD